MCYFLYLASPLTLSEIRSMLPPGVTADLASYAAQQTFKAVHRNAQTVAVALVGRCSCDLVRQRLPVAKDDERHLRDRYRKLGVPREAVIQALERHRHGRRNRDEYTARVLVEFVTEHARNAGASLYYLHFSPQGDPPESLAPPQQITPAQIAESPERWLAEGVPVLVTRS